MKLRTEEESIKVESRVAEVKLPASYDPTAFARTDLGNAERLVVRHGLDLRHCPPMRTWFVYDNNRWREDTTNEVMRRATETIRAIQVEAADLDGDERAALIKHGLGSEKGARLRDMVSLAASREEMPVLIDQLDADPYLLNLKNGTLEMRGANIVVRLPRREDLITNEAGAAYDPQADCPTFKKFLVRIFPNDEPTIAFIQRIVGYCLLGHAKDQCFFVFWGDGSNGKGTLVNIIRDLLGSYSQKAGFATFLVNKEQRSGSAPSPDLARLRGARVVMASESEQGRRLNEAMIKDITGGEKITARNLYQGTFEYLPVFKLILSSNYKPVVTGTDYGIRRRIHFIPFRQQIGKEEEDKHFDDKLRAELSGILNWALDGLRDYLDNGLSVPDSVKNATTQYLSEMDTFQEFLDDRCQTHPGLRARSTDLLEAYNLWAKPLGHPLHTSRTLAVELEHHKFESKKSGVMWWLGLGLATAAELGARREVQMPTA